MTTQVPADSKVIAKDTLKDGSQVPAAVLRSTMDNLQCVANEGFALLDLVEKCKDPNYKLGDNPGGSKTILSEYALLQDDGRVHDIVKVIVLNATEGRGASLKLVDPRKKA